MAEDARRLSIFTLGHSRHAIEHFIALARDHGIELIVDVRGRPYSRFNPQFNRERFRESLEAAGIGYLWLGDRLSGRPKEPDFYGPDGAVLWDRLAHWPALHEGIGEVLERAGESRLALVCAEENPAECHRRFLLTPPLEAAGAEVRHIRGDGRIETEDALTALLGENSDDGQLDLFDKP